MAAGTGGHRVEVQYPEVEAGCRWSLVVDGHGTVATSEESHPHEYAAEDDVEAVRAAAADAEVRTFDEPTLLTHHYEVEKRSLIPFVGSTTAVREGAERLVSADGTERLSGGWREPLSADDTFESREAAEAAIDATVEAAEEAVAVDVEGPAFELFADEDGHGWRLVDGTGETLVVGEGRHDDEAAVRDVVETLSRWAASDA